MHRLQRPSEPQALTRARKRELSNWGEFPSADRKVVRDALAEMQDGCCAYCEGRLEGSEGHIDHFRKRADHPERTFDWSNLFVSCDAQVHCARHKDGLRGSERPDYDLVLDPCRDEPEMYLFFLADGRIVPRHGLTEEERKRADETIRVFALNEPGLVQRRRALAKEFLSTLKGMGSQDDVCHAIDSFSHCSGHRTLFIHLAGRGTNFRHDRL